MFKQDNERVHKLLNGVITACDGLHELQKEAKRYYEETDDEWFKDIFCLFNKSISDSAVSMLTTNANVAARQVNLFIDVLKANEGIEGS